MVGILLIPPVFVKLQVFFAGLISVLIQNFIILQHI